MNTQVESAFAQTDNVQGLPEHRPFVVRMNPEKVARLMDTAGELAAAECVIRNRLTTLGMQDESISRALERISRGSTEIQRNAMSMRMVTAKELFGRSANLIRDLAQRANKPIPFEMRGGETKLDKSVAEVLSRPLLNLVRSAVEGIVSLESPPQNNVCLTLSALQERTEILVEVNHSAKGLQEYSLTSDERTAIARDLASIRGRLAITVSPQAGITCSIRIPISLPLIQAVLVIAGSRQVAIPLSAVDEIVQVKQLVITRPRDGQEVALLRGQLFPFCRLWQCLNLRDSPSPVQDAVMVIAEVHGHRVGFWCDRLIAVQNVVVKPIEGILLASLGISGCAVLGNGQVEPILDLSTLYERLTRPSDGRTGA